MIASDLHLGHSNICKFREGFRDAEHHHQVIYERLKSSIGKRDTLILLGDVAFTPYWNDKIKEIECTKKVLILGNHDTDRQVHLQDLVDTYDEIHALWKAKGVWFSHAPIHPQELRGKMNVHGHLHTNVVEGDNRYINVCVDHLEDFKPVNFQELMKGRWREVN